MAVTDYIRKHAHTAATDGVAPAIRQATSEAVLRLGMPIANERATPIWDADWDVCLVLDACRYDLWTEVTEDIPWLPTASKWSVGSASPEWISKTFKGRHEHEVAKTGYVTANPFSGKEGTELDVMNPEAYRLEERLAYLDEVWRDEWPASDDLPTVRPSTVTDRALWAYQTEQAEQLVVHYMQPHIPFVSKPEWCEGWDLDGFGTGGGRSDKDDWERVRDGEIDADEFWRAYRNNLKWVLTEVERWVDVTEAEILITSDHGNAMGELGQWSHPPRSANPVLRRVPWVQVEGTGARDIQHVQEPPTSTTDKDVESRLEALGYKQ